MSLVKKRPPQQSLIILCPLLLHGGVGGGVHDDESLPGVIGCASGEGGGDGWGV